VTAAAAPPASGPRPRTVVHLITTLTQGGAERVLSEVVPLPGERGLDDVEERHVVVSLAPGGMFADVLRARGVEVRDLGMRPGRDVVRGIRRLRAVLTEVEATDVIAWMYHACLVATIACGSRGSRPDGRRIQPLWFLQSSLADTGVLSWHARAVIRILAIISTRQDVIAANSTAGIVDHRAAGFRPRSWLLLQNGCDTTHFRPDSTARTEVRSQLGIDEDDVVVAFVGRNHPEKGFDRLVAAASEIEDSRVRFVALGEGTEHAPAPILGLGVSDSVNRALAASDVFVLPSRTEGIPNALLEAMACGLPAVVTDVGDCRTILGEAGIVLPADVDREGLAAALTALTAASPAERARLGALARLRIEAEYSLVTAREDYRAAWRTPAEPDGSHDVRA